MSVFASRAYVNAALREADQSERELRKLFTESFTDGEAVFEQMMEDAVDNVIDSQPDQSVFDKEALKKREQELRELGLR